MDSAALEVDLVWEQLAVGDNLGVLEMEGTRSLEVPKVRPVVGWVRRRIDGYPQVNRSAQSTIPEERSSVDGHLQALYPVVLSKDPRQPVAFVVVGAVHQLKGP
jgi:hypothetical protein